jgi:hypothetical protein
MTISGFFIPLGGFTITGALILLVGADGAIAHDDAHFLTMRTSEASLF